MANALTASDKKYFMQMSQKKRKSQIHGLDLTGIHDSDSDSQSSYSSNDIGYSKVKVEN